MSESDCLKLKNIEIVFHTGGPTQELLEFCNNKLSNIRAIVIAKSLFESKILSEKIIDDDIKNSNNVPVVLIRLPILGPAYKEPFPGFLEILRGPSAIMIGAGYAFGHADLPAEVVPVDIAVNALITAAWQRGIR